MMKNLYCVMPYAKDYKGKISILLNVIGIGVSFLNTSIAITAFVIIAVWWFVPEHKIEKIKV